MLIKLSELDKQILKMVLPDCRVTSDKLMVQTGLSLKEINQRRNQLEKDLLVHSCSMNLGIFGYRRIDLMIYTTGGSTLSIAKKLLERNEVVYAGRSIGEHTIDLRVEVIVKSNSDILN